MKRRFVIAVEGLDQSQTKQVSDLFREKYGWWHWIDGFWLVTDVSGNLNAQKIRDMIGEINPNCRRMVIEVANSGSWAGYGPNTEERNMFRWIRKTWS
ncbi:MAG: hypothetical protein OXI64_05460 [Defluviicoccus sp.]|nr:hypothetical protein [Defluviicoccus sp.]